MVVDDDPALLDELEQILVQEEFEVETVNQSVFKQIIERSDPDLILIDVWFGKNPDGMTMTQALRSSRQLHDVPIILMSSDGLIANYSAKVGADTYLEKPLDVDELLFTINSLVN